MTNTEINDFREEQIVFGWKNIEDAACDVYNSAHNQLLLGYPVFLYKPLNTKSDLVQLIVVKNYQEDQIKPNSYSVGIITKGWSVCYPNVPLEYLEGDLTEDLKKWKVEEDIIKTYKQLLAREK